MLYLNKPLPPRKILGCDIETSGLDPFTGHLLSVAFSDGTDVWVFLNNLHALEDAATVLCDPAVTKVFHNAKFDLKWLKHHLNVEVTPIFDTQLAEGVLTSGKGLSTRDDDGEIITASLPLDLLSVLSRRMGLVLNKATRNEFIDHPGFDVVPITTEQLDYIVDDVLYLPALREQQIDQASKEGAIAALRLEFEVVPACVDLELGGVRLDESLWETQLVEFEEHIARYDGVMRQILSKKTSIVPVPGRKNKQDILRQIAVEDVNFNSPAQLIQVLGLLGYTTDTTAVASLEAALEEDILSEHASAFVRALLEHRKWIKRRGFDYQKYVNPVTGKVHPDFHQLGARTGRFSCSNPNLQQVPRPVKGEPNLRNVWIADTEDCVLIRSDYSQQEPRIMAQLSGDPAMIEACNKEDVYIEFAKYMYGRAVEKGSPERHHAKTFVLAVGYGAGVDKLHATTGIPREECETTRDIIKQSFPLMARFGSMMERRMQMYGYVETALGRRRYIRPGPGSFSQAVNTPVQGTGADMLKIALVHLHHWLKEHQEFLHPETRVWSLVHDEIVVQCHLDDVALVQPKIKEIMEEAGAELCPDVKHIAESAYSYRWDK